MSETIGSAYIQIEPSAQGIKGKLSSILDGEASQAGTSAGGKLSSALGSAVAVGATAIAGATAAVGAFGKASVDAGMQFDSSMSQVAATMGYAIDESGNYIKTINGQVVDMTGEFESLRNFAQEMGSTTAFSASEAADALNYMALAGYDADTSMEVLPSVLDLAAAGGIGLADASDMVTDALSAFGLKSTDAATMVDQMALTASKSNTSVAQLGEAFLTIGANAKSLSGGTTELSTALGILADNGIKGAEGGTHLRNIMLALNPTTDKAVSAWEKLGVSAYDTQGNLRPLEDTFGDLNKAMEGMSDQEKTDILTKMFNKTDLASINALLATDADRWTELGTAIDGASGSAKDMAGVQLNNLSGDITLFQSALEGAKIAVSDQLTPALREFVQFGSTGLSELTTAFNEGGFEGAMSKAGELIGELANKVIEMLPQMIEAGMQLLSSLAEGIMQNLPQLTQTAVEIITMLSEYIIEALPQIIEAGLQIIVQLALGIAEALPELIPTIVDVVLQITETLIDNVDLLVDGAIALVVGLAEGIINALPRLIEKAPEIVLKLCDAIIRNAPKLLEASVELMISLAKGIVDNLPKMVEASIEIVNTVVNKIKELKDRLLEVGSDMVEGIKEGIRNAWDSLTSWLSDLCGDLVSIVKNALKIGSPSKVFRDEVGQWIPEGIAVGIDGNISTIDDAMMNVQSSLSTDDLATTGTITSDFSSNEQPNENNEIIKLLNTYLPMLINREIVLDTGKTVGALAPEMNKELGRLAVRGAI